MSLTDFQVSTPIQVVFFHTMVLKYHLWYSSASEPVDLYRYGAMRPDAILRPRPDGVGRCSITAAAIRRTVFLSTKLAPGAASPLFSAACSSCCLRTTAC